MNDTLRKLQIKLLDVSRKVARDFALAGGTALELYYLHHRFSADLDFFSPNYDVKEIEKLIATFDKKVKTKAKLESELSARGQAKVRFYSLPIKGSKRPLKIDFVEDVLFKKPIIKKFNGVRVYSVDNIYLQKIIAITGTRPEFDEIGMEITVGRREARDVYDLYMLSKKVKPLNESLLNIDSSIQRGMVQWYRTFSREDLKLNLLDLDIYDKKFNPREMIIYLEGEIKKFIKEVL